MVAITEATAPSSAAICAIVRVVFHVLLATLTDALLMLWQTFWALAFGFGLSAFLQIFVRREDLTKRFGHADLRSVGLATFLGAVSSSCSYAAVAAARSAFKKGAALVPTLAFMFASTNLVLELGFVLWLFLGWRFVLAEGVGSFVLIGLMWALVRLFFPQKLVEEARRHGDVEDEGGPCCHGGHDHGDHAGHHHSFSHKLRDPKSWAAMADAFRMDVSMMWKEIVIGFLIAGFLMTSVPDAWWKVLFLSDSAPAALRVVENCVVGVIIAMASFVCSVGNIPLASLLWSGGIGFGGVISFIYADLVIIPILILYRKAYGLRAAAAISAVLFASMVGAGIIIDLLFNALGLVPKGPRPPSLAQHEHFQWNYTTWLDLAVAAALLALFVAARTGKGGGNQKPASHEELEGHSAHHRHPEPAH
jgi:uncharacterized membrane protein YraQ (UPF0718 family)